jgi:hypothetical protein
MGWISGIKFLAGTGNSSSAPCSNRPVLEPILSPFHGGLFPGIKWLEHEGDYSPPSKAKVRNVWNLPPLPQCIEITLPLCYKIFFWDRVRKQLLIPF